jgi:hypothetical protein
MQAQIKVGRIAGISIGLRYSWFIIALDYLVCSGRSVAD